MVKHECRWAYVRYGLVTHPNNGRWECLTAGCTEVRKGVSEFVDPRFVENENPVDEPRPCTDG